MKRLHNLGYAVRSCVQRCQANAEEITGTLRKSGQTARSTGSRDSSIRFPIWTIARSRSATPGTFDTRCDAVKIGAPDRQARGASSPGHVGAPNHAMAPAPSTLGMRIFDHKQCRTAKAGWFTNTHL